MRPFLTVQAADQLGEKRGSLDVLDWSDMSVREDDGGGGCVALTIFGNRFRHFLSGRGLRMLDNRAGRGDPMAAIPRGGIDPP
jgi:hypothetical protein